MAPEPGPRSPSPPAPVVAAGPPLAPPVIMTQWWRDIAFVHWRVDPDRVAPLLPPGVRPDLFDGSAWVGLIPFRLVGGTVGRGRPVPWLGTFLETNVRVYSVDDAGRRGVVFRSLESQRAAVVAGAVTVFGTPYRWARMSATGDGRRHRYRTRRRGLGARPRSDLEVETTGPIDRPSDLDLFLTARFGLHTRVRGRALWVPNTHGPWPLERARVRHLDDELVAAAGLPGVADTAPASVLWSAGVRAEFGRPVRL